MKKKLRGLCVCVVSAAMLAACAITTPTAAEPVQEQITETTTAAEETAVSAAEETEAGNVIENNSDLTTIRMFIPLTRSVDADKIQEITDAVNAISESEIGVHVDLVTAEVATFNTSLPLALASGESYDVVQLMPYPPLNLNSMYTANQLMDISPYLEEYGQGILSVTGDYLDAVTINGGVYMVPNVRNYASSLYVLICKEYIDGAGVAEQFENMTTVEDLEAVCEAVYEKYGIPVFAGGQNDDEKYFAHGTNGIIMASTGSFEENSVVYDNLGDSLYCFGTDPDTNSVYSLYESEAFINGCIKAKEWYDKGWLYKDAPFSTEAQSTIVKNGAACGFFVTSELGVEAAKESIVGKPMYAKKLVDAYVTSGVVNRFGLGVPTTASEPEAAVAFMDLLLTNGELNDIFNWGIEGEDWVMSMVGQHMLVIRYGIR